MSMSMSMFMGRPMYYNKEFDRFPVDNRATILDLDAKAAALKTAQSVVSLISYSGDEKLFICCGVIMDCESRLGSSILTSATLLRSRDGAPNLATDLKIDVYTLGGTLFKGVLVAVDFQYNLATVDILNDSPLSIPCITSSRSKLCRGDQVLALARHYEEPYDVMVAYGQVRFDPCSFDCKELVAATCKIKKNGIGGPLINLHGDVVGINFYAPSYTPFLPMNIVNKCFEDLKKRGHVSQPSIGVVVRDLLSTSLRNLENLYNNFPHVVKGAFVDKVLLDSPAHIAGLCAADVIIHCNGEPVESCFEFTEMLWGKEGKAVELAVVRVGMGEQFNIVVDVMDGKATENRWPIPELRAGINHPLFSTLFCDDT